MFYLAPSAPQNLQLQVKGPTGISRPQIVVTWGKPANENGIIKKYTLNYSYTFDGKVKSFQHITDDQTFRYSFDVLGGVKYTINLWAETIKPGPKAAKLEQVPVYSK